MRIAQANRFALCVLVLFTLLLDRPIFFGKTYSMVAAHMYGQYPWITRVPVPMPPSITGNGFPQTDQAETFYPLSAWATNTIHTGELPMWMDCSFGGFPLVELGSGVFYPPRFLLTLAFTPIVQHDILLLSHLLLAGFGMYFFLRRWDLHPFGCALGALVWEANGHNAFWFVLEHIAIAAAWIPWSLLAATIAVERRSRMWAGAAGFFLGFAALSGSIHYVYLGGLILGAYYVGLVARTAIDKRSRSDAGGLLILGGIALVVAVGVSAALWLPMTESLASVYRLPKDLSSHLLERIQFRQLLKALLSPATGSASREPITSAFVGVPALLFAVVGLFQRRYLGRLGAFLVVAGASFALGLKPMVVLLRALPFFGTVHLPAGIFIFVFGMALLAAAGVDILVRQDRKPGVAAFGAVVCFILVILNAGFLVMFFWAENPEQPRRTEWLYPETPLISAARRLQRDRHVLPVQFRLADGAWTPPVLAGKTAAIFGLHSESGYESLLPTYIAGLWRTVEQNGELARSAPGAYRPYFYYDRLPFDLLEKAAVGFLITPPRVTPIDEAGVEATTSGRLDLVYDGSDGRIFRLRRSVPRALMARRVEFVHDQPLALVRFMSPGFDPRVSAVIVEDGDSGRILSNDARAATANIVLDRSNRVDIRTEAGGARLLVLEDSWDDDWKAFVDGTERDVLRVNYTFRGVIVPAGSHVVSFRYRPPLVIAGLGITMLFLVGFPAVAILTRVRYCHRPANGL